MTFDRKPRASGDDPRRWVRVGRRRMVNPARAGMIQMRVEKPVCRVGKPRASGDDPDMYIRAQYGAS